MKRGAAFILVLLVFGAIINVAVACGAILWGPISYRFHEGEDWVERKATTDEIAQLHDAFPTFAFTAGEYLGTGTRRFGWMGSEVRWVDENAPGGLVVGDDGCDSPSVWCVVSGYPMPSLRHFSTRTKSTQTQSGILVAPKFLGCV